MPRVSAIWVGNPFFQSALAEECGWRVHWINPAVGTVLTAAELAADAGFEPDVVVVADKSIPPFVTGMETLPCLTVFYAVDTHIHSWFPRYAQGFDVCLVSLKDHMSLFLGARHTRDTVWWSPPYAHPADAPRAPDPEKPVWDVLFLGTVNPNVNPERCAFLDALAPHVPGLHVTRGSDRAALYAQAKIALNHAVAGDLNFRVFEALGCGVCLVTPLVRHGLTDVFANGRDLFTYDPADIPGLAALLNSLLAAPRRRETVARQGHAAVAAGHYMRHRAEAFAGRVEELLASGKARAMIASRRAAAKTIHASRLKLLYLHHADSAPTEQLAAAYLKAARESA